MSRTTIKFLCGGAVLLSAVAYLAYAGLKEGWVSYHLDVDQYVNDSQYHTQRVRLFGKVDENGLVSNPGRLSAKFTLVGQAQRIPVVYSGVIPDLFKGGCDVVIEGSVPSVRPYLDRAFATAKRVRTQTEIGRGITSLSQVAVELVEKIFGDLQGRAVALLGAGKMGALSAKALASLGAARVLVANRSPERALALAEQVGGTPRPWADLVPLLDDKKEAVRLRAASAYLRLQTIRKRPRPAAKK